MNIRKGLLFTVVLLLVALTAASAAIVIPRNTVIPVILDNTLSSSANRVGDTFYSHLEGPSGAGFPVGTRFMGRILSVVRASGNVPGQIEVEFTRAILPDGTSVPLRGELTSLDSRSVRLDANTGRLVSTVDSRSTTRRFIAYGAGAGLLIGELLADKPLVGAIIGAAAGYLYGRQRDKDAVGRELTVPAGAKFGILLAQDASIPTAGVPGPIGSGPTYGEGWQVRFGSVRPIVRANTLLIPFSYVMNEIAMPFSYNSSSKLIRVYDGASEIRHTVGTRFAYVDGRRVALGAMSRIVNGYTYVPGSFIELLTDRTVYYSPRTRVLRIE